MEKQELFSENLSTIDCHDSTIDSINDLQVDFNLWVADILSSERIQEIKPPVKKLRNLAMKKKWQVDILKKAYKEFGSELSHPKLFEISRRADLHEKVVYKWLWDKQRRDDRKAQKLQSQAVGN